MAYLECVQQLRLTAELVERFGVEGMRRRISPAALYGDLTRGARIIDERTRFRLKEILGEIRSGAFAREYLERATRDPQWAETELRRARRDRLEQAGETIRGLQSREADPPEGGENR